MTRKDIKANYIYTDISNNVIQNVTKELEHINYKPQIIVKKSLNPDDKDLYVVVGRRKNSEEYAFWSCYNDTRQTLNHGHYNYTDYEKCIDDAFEFVN